MLFSRVFNWIKYKTLPPSILFTNRLFIERDSKHRRLLSNLGLTFRNSKWSMYTRTNINTTNYIYLFSSLTVILILGTLMILCKTQSCYYDLLSVLNYCMPFLWFTIDLDVYIITIQTFFSWLVLNNLYESSIFSLFYYSGFKVQTTMSSSSSNITNPLSIPKRLHKPLLCYWAKNTEVDLNQIHSFTANYYLVQLQCQTFFRQLYQLVKVITVEHHTLVYYHTRLDNIELQIQSTWLKLKNLELLKTLCYIRMYYSLCIDYKLRYSVTTEYKALNEFNNWTFDLIASLWALNVTKGSQQPFYLRELTFSDLNYFLERNHELWALTFTLESHASIQSICRWMYKYSLLHRSSLRDSAQTTFALQNLSHSFYSSTFFSRNMWTSSMRQSKTSTNWNWGSYHEALYATRTNEAFNYNFISSLFFQNELNVSQLNFVPSSYFWVLQRFSNFNTLTNHVIQWNESLISKSTISSYSVLPLYCNSATQLTWYLHNNCVTYNSPLRDEQLSAMSLKTALLFPNITNIYLSYYDYNFFTKRKLELSLNTVANHGSRNLLFYTLQPLYTF